MQQSRLSRDNTIIKIKTSARVNPQANITAVNSNSNNKFSLYPLNAKGQVTLPLEQFIIYRNGAQVAQIDLKPICQYPQYEHHIHTRPYNQKSPFEDTQQTLLTLTFNQIPQNMLSQGLPLKLTLIDAQITHDTQLVGKMDPYVKVKVNSVDKWRSKTVKKGDKFPNFNRQSVNLQVKALNDNVGIQVWDDDMSNDDFVGGANLRVFEIVGRGQEVLQFPIMYTKKDKIISAGKIRFQVQSPNIF